MKIVVLFYRLRSFERDCLIEKLYRFDRAVDRFIQSM